jgi:hypothetical protein
MLFACPTSLAVCADARSAARAEGAENCRATTVIDCLHRARRAGLAWPLPDEIDDAILEVRLYPPRPTTPIDRLAAILRLDKINRNRCSRSPAAPKVGKAPAVWFSSQRLTSAGDSFLLMLMCVLSHTYGQEENSCQKNATNPGFYVLSCVFRHKLAMESSPMSVLRTPKDVLHSTLGLVAKRLRYDAAGTA